jgi:glutathione synthase
VSEGGRRSLFVMDPFRTVHIDKDTTYAFMREAQRRGHPILACRTSDLGSRHGRAFAHAKRVEVLAEPTRPFRIVERVTLPLDDCDLVFMRKDPPFNIDYVFATYLLDGVDPTRTWVINRPSGLREANEKAFILRFPEIIPATVVTKRTDDLYAFLDEQGGRCIVKPLDGMGGSGVLLLRRDDPNLSSLIEMSTQFNTRYVMLQAYVPEARLGDKRIIVIDGEPVGATLRVPPAGELRGNIHVGAVCVKTEVTARDRDICAHIAPALRELGLWFTGIDVLGDYLTEINVTSPTGVHEINRLDGVCLEARFWDFVEGRLG